MKKNYETGFCSRVQNSELFLKIDHEFATDYSHCRNQIVFKKLTLTEYKKAANSLIILAKLANFARDSLGLKNLHKSNF